MFSLIHRLQHHADLGENSLAVLMRLAHRVVDRLPGQAIVSLGEAVTDVFVIEEGWAIRYRLLDDGRRQIVNFMTPGDCFDLQALVSAKADHYVSALTRLRLRAVSGTQFLSAVRSNGALATAFWWSAVQEESILREHIVRIGRRSARERVAHLLVELNRRLAMAGVLEAERAVMPLTRDVMGDALGLSPVHVSRTLTALRLRGMIEVARRSVKLKDVAALARLAGYSEGYLHVQDRVPLADRDPSPEAESA